MITGDVVLERTAQFSKNLRILAHGDYQDAKHLADYVALLSRVIFLAALSAIIWKHALSGLDQILYYPLAAGMTVLVLHLMKHIYWMSYDYISSFFGEKDGNRRETAVLVLSAIVTMLLIAGIIRLYLEIIQSQINIGAWVTAHDQP